MVRGEAKVVPIATELGVGSFADHRYANRRALGSTAILRVGHVCAVCNRAAHGGENSGAFDRVAALALPIDGPAAALISDVVRALAGDVNSSRVPADR